MTTAPDPDELDAAALEPRGSLPDPADIGAALSLQYLRAVERAQRTTTHVDPVLALAVAAYLRAAGACGPCSVDVALEASGRRTGDEVVRTWPRGTLAQYVRQLDDRGPCRHGRSSSTNATYVSPNDDAVRIVEDTIDATSDEWTDQDDRRVSSPSDRTGPAIVAALVDAGWQPPGAPDDPARAVLREVLATFTDHGYIGRPCVRSTWQHTEQLDAWRATLKP